jgi:nucleoside-diphosphate-sugar epimerase
VRYVVTGAAGFIGSHLAEFLIAGGHDVVAIDCFTDYYDPALKEENARSFDVVRADLAEADLDELFAGADGVFHLAGQPGVRGSWGDEFALYARRNLVVTHRVFEAAARAGTRVVFASSSSVYGNAERYPTSEEVEPQPIAAYGITKLGCEHLAHAYAGTLGLNAVVLRYFTVYGPRQRPDMAFRRLVDALASGGSFPLYGDGSFSRSFTYVDDVVAATRVAMERAPGGAVYNVGGGEEATMAEAIALLEDVSGRKLERERLPSAAGDMRRTAADTRRITNELGWVPRTSLREGLRAQWDWVQGRPGVPPTQARSR